MNLLYESLWPSLTLGAVLFFFLFSFWLITRKGFLLAALFVPLAVIAGGYYLEQSVETDREAVERTFDNISASLKADDLLETERYLTADAKETVSRVKWALKTVKIRKVGFYDLNLEVNNFTSPPIATADFHGVVKYTLKNGSDYNPEIYSAHFTVELEKQEGNRAIPWLVTDHVEYSGGL